MLSLGKLEGTAAGLWGKNYVTLNSQWNYRGGAEIASCTEAVMKRKKALIWVDARIFK